MLYKIKINQWKIDKKGAGKNLQCDVDLNIDSKTTMPLSIEDLQTYRLFYISRNALQQKPVPDDIGNIINKAFVDKLPVIFDKIKQFDDFNPFKLSFGYNKGEYYNLEFVAYKKGASPTSSKEFKQPTGKTEKYTTQYSEQIIINIHIRNKESNLISSTMLEEIAACITTIIDEAIKSLPKDLLDSKEMGEIKIVEANKVFYDVASNNASFWEPENKKSEQLSSTRKEKKDKSNTERKTPESWEEEFDEDLNTIG